MTSFPAQARRVRDRRLTPQRRLNALRECVVHFAPYGFRATWHHLIVSAAIPRNLHDDPDALVRAVDELEQARHLLLPHVVAYTTRRRREKAAGRRVPDEPAPWNSWGWCTLAWCPDPERHPKPPLPTVVRQILERHAAGISADDQCLACATPRRRPHRACPSCGVQPDGPDHRRYDACSADRWRRIWNRDITD